MPPALLATGLGLAFVSLLPDFAPWVRIRGCEAYQYDAWSGGPGFAIAAAILMVGAAMFSATRDRLAGAWISLLAAGGVIGGTALASLFQVDALVARHPAPLDTCDFFAGIPRGSESLALAYGPWLALAGGVLLIASGAVARIRRDASPSPAQT